MGAVAGKRSFQRTQSTQVPIAPLLATLAILLQPWIVLSQPSEQSLLYDFYNSTGGWFTTCSGGWSTNTTPLCDGNNTTWAKVTCRAGRVIQLNLGGCRIRGTLPPQWDSLTYMQTLYLNGNFLNGTLPSQWSNLTNMQTLLLHGNALSGTLPWQWSSLTNMQYLTLSSNSLSGTLPSQWSNMTNIQYLNLNFNFLNGTLASQWNNLTNMQYLSVTRNFLGGTLPPEWSSLTNMQYLQLDNNSLSGTLPWQWSNLTIMRTVALSSNSLSGTLPWQWSSLTNLQTLSLYSNSLSGTLPPRWSNLRNMRNLDLSNNSLSGALPTEWSALSSTLTCWLDDNCLNTSNATAWWLDSTYRNIGGQRTTRCVVIVPHGASNGASLSSSNTRSVSVTGSRSLVFSTSSMSATYSLPSGSCPLVSASSLSVGILGSRSVSITAHSSSATWSRWLASAGSRSIGFAPTSVDVANSLHARGSFTFGTYSTSWSDTHRSSGSLWLAFARISKHFMPSLSGTGTRSRSQTPLSTSLAPATPQTRPRTGRSVRYGSTATWSRWFSSSFVSMLSLSGTPTAMSPSQDTYSPSTASLTYEESTTNQVLGTMSLTPLCDAPPFSINSSLRVAQPNNESHCGEHLCPTASPSLIDGVGGVTLAVAYDAMMAAPSVLLLLAEDGIRASWLSLLPSVRLGTVALDAVAHVAPSDGTVGVVVLRPNSGWPGVDVRPYAVQRLSLVVALRCRSANGTVVSHPSEIVLVLTPRFKSVAASVQAVVQSSQGIAGGLGSGGGAETLIIGRLVMSLSMLSCDDALQGFGAGLGVVSVSGDLLAAVDTIVGNVVFVAGVTVAAVLAACVLYLYASSCCSWMACCHDAMRLPLSLFPVFAATLPSTVMAVVALLRDAPALSGGAASGAYCSIALAAAVWGGALVLVGSAMRRMALSSTLRPAKNALRGPATVAGCGSGAVVLTFRRAFQSSTEWVALQAADTTLFEGTTVLWFLPLDVCTTVAIAVASALPLSRSAALCVGAHAVNVAGCAVMLAVAAVRRPFATAFGMIHSIVTYAMVLALAVCGLVLAATSSSRAADNGDAHSMLLVVSYLSGSAAVLSALKAAGDAVGIVATTRRRFLTLTVSRTQSCVGEGTRLDDVVAGDKAGENDCHLILTLPVSDGGFDAGDIGALELEDPHDLLDDSPPQLFPEEDMHDHRSRLGDLLDAYQNVDAKGRRTQP